MARALHNFLTVLSFLLFLTGAWLWVRSHRHYDCVTRHGQVHRLMNEGHAYTWYFASAFGRLGVYEELEYQSAGQFPLDFPDPGWRRQRSDAAEPTHRNAARNNWPIGVRHMIPHRDRHHWLYPRYVQFPNFIATGQGRNQFIRGISFPWWMPVLACSILPLARLAFFLRSRHRRSRGLCLRCGYDLRASFDRCPECGEAVAQT